MNKLLTTLFALAVASATGLAHAQQAPAAGQPAPSNQQPAKAAPGASSQPQAGAPASPKSLEAKVAMCMGCHNIPGYQASFPEVHRVPMIAGQSAGYIAAALNAYKNGDRKHPTMRGIADALSEQDIKDISNWYANLAGPSQLKGDKPSREPNQQVAALLQKAACVSCHGANFSKPIDPSYPKVAGQYADYLFVALKAYKTDNNGAVGRNNGIMGGIAKQFSNAELRAMSNYLASLEGDLKTVPESRFVHK